LKRNKAIKGTIRERGDKFEYVIDVGTGGKRKQATGIRDTREEAELALIEINRSLKLGQKVDSVKMEEFITGYFEKIVQHEVRPSTYLVQSHHVKKINAFFGQKRVDAITIDDIESFYHHLLMQGLGKGTIRDTAMVLRKTFKYAVTKRIILHDISREVKPYTYKPPKMKIWKTEQVRHFIETVKDTERYPMYALFFATGMRIGEFCGLFSTDLNLIDNKITIERQLLFIKGRGYVHDALKTENSERKVLLPKHVVEVLQEHSKHGRLPLFHEKGEPIKPPLIRLLFKSDIKAAGLPPIRVHDIRHTVATKLLSEGKPLVTVADILGDTPQTVNSTYAHVIPSMLESAVTSLEDFYA